MTPDVAMPSEAPARSASLPRMAKKLTAITLLAGVDAILRAAPNQSASTLLSPWSLGAASGEGEATQQ